jgi:hypothetical protein
VVQGPAAALGVAVAVLALAGCTSGSSGGGPATPTSTGAVAPTDSGSSSPPSPSDSATASASAVPYASLAASPQVAIGSTSATPAGFPAPVRLDVLAVESTASGTLLRFRLVTDTKTSLILSAFQGRPKEPDVGGLTLVASAVAQRLHVSYAGDTVCLCSALPVELGPQGSFLSALFPALPASVTQVQVAAPGFPPISVPVTRR